MSALLFLRQIRRLSTEVSFTKVSLLGRVGSDPKLRGTDAKPYIVFNVATNVRAGDEIKTQWHKVCVFRAGLVDIAQAIVKSGCRVLVDGKLTQNTYTNQEDQTVLVYSVVADSLLVLQRPMIKQSQNPTAFEESEAVENKGENEDRENQNQEFKVDN